MAAFFKRIVLISLTLLVCTLVAYLTLQSSVGEAHTGWLDGEALMRFILEDNEDPVDWLCLEEVDYLDYGFAAEGNKTLSTKANESHLLKPIGGNTKMKQYSMLSRLWNFRDIGDQLLYVYEQLVKKDWTANQTNANILRQELARYRPELNDSTAITLHQKNVNINETVKQVYSKKPINITAEIFHRLPKSDPIGLPKGKRYHSCALVGNSGSILHSGCGERIDKHDYVIRCNLAPLAPFKVDAGLKSDYITMNPSIIRTRYSRFRTKKAIKKFNVDVSKYSGILSIPCFGVRLPEVMEAFKLFKGKKPKMVCMNNKHFQSVIDFWRSTGAINKGLSTGFYMVSMAIQLCDKVDLYGFWPFSSRFESNKTDVAYHYFDNLRADTAVKAHAMNQEFSIIVQLHNLGIAKLNIGAC